jgi:protein-L-isoaspartate(D-aspartate) O-methyltransferase
MHAYGAESEHSFSFPFYTLSQGGRLVIPVGDEYQELIVVTREGASFQERRVLPVRFVPMTGKVRQ